MCTVKVLLTGLFLVLFMGHEDAQSLSAGKPGNYRHVGHRAYEVLDTTGFCLYRYNKLVQGEKIARPTDVYYFSAGATDPVQELTMANLESVFSGNARFRYALEAQFRSDKDLIAYDGQLKTYKIKWVYAQSSK